MLNLIYVAIYYIMYRSWFCKKCTKEEFDRQARRLLTQETVHLHNQVETPPRHIFLSFMVLISFMYVYCTYVAEYRRIICNLEFRRILCNSLFWYIQDIFIEIFGEAGQSGQN